MKAHMSPLFIKYDGNDDIDDDDDDGDDEDGG
jgi:hypothetical protein